MAQSDKLNGWMDGWMDGWIRRRTHESVVMGADRFASQSLFNLEGCFIMDRDRFCGLITVVLLLKTCNSYHWQAPDHTLV